MSSDGVNMIWLTRGKDWGFRFLASGSGGSDPLLAYEDVFDSHTDEATFCYQVSGGRVALRLLDPLGRKDRAGRDIAHDFVVFGDLASQVRNIDDGLRILWPMVSEKYEEVWDG